MKSICSLCVKPLDDVEAYQLMCDHTFHKSCIENHRDSRNKPCPKCGGPICKKYLTSEDLWTLTDFKQCTHCKWIPIKKVRWISSDYFKLEYWFNHHCHICAINCYFFNKRFHKNDLYSIRNCLVTIDGSPVISKEGSLPNSHRRCDKYDYLYCKVCHQQVIGYHDKIGLPNEYIYSFSYKDNGCKECHRLTWGSVFQKTEQKLPTCSFCHQLVSQKEFYKRVCCGLKKPHHFDCCWHFDCSWINAKCPNCKTECKISFIIKAADLLLKNFDIIPKIMERRMSI